MDTPCSNSEIVAGYFANFIEGGDGPNFWAFEEMSELVSADPERAWGLAIEMLRGSSDPLYTAYVAAGPLEDLLSRHGRELIGRIEVLAKSEPWFRECLVGVWGTLQPDIRERVNNAIKSDV